MSCAYFDLGQARRTWMRFAQADPSPIKVPTGYVVGAGSALMGVASLAIGVGAAVAPTVPSDVRLVWPCMLLGPLFIGLAVVAFRYARAEQRRLERAWTDLAARIGATQFGSIVHMARWLCAYWYGPYPLERFAQGPHYKLLATMMDGFAVAIEGGLAPLRRRYGGAPARCQVLVAATWPAVPGLREGAAMRQRAISQLRADLAAAGWTCAPVGGGVVVDARQDVVRAMRRDPSLLATLEPVVRQAIWLTKQLGGTPAPPSPSPAR